MAPARSLHDIFAGLTGTAGAHDPAEALRHGGHDDLPPQLLGEALVNYADTAAIEVAEQLAPFVTAHTGFAAGPDAAADPTAALDLLAAAVPPPVDPDGGWEEPLDPLPTAEVGDGTDPSGSLDTAFGSGSDAVGELPGPDPVTPAADPATVEAGPTELPTDDPDGSDDAWSGLDPYTDLAAELDDVDGDASDPGWV